MKKSLLLLALFALSACATQETVELPPVEPVSGITWNGFSLPSLEGLYWCGTEASLMLSYEDPAEFELEYPDCASDAPNYGGSDIPLPAWLTKNVHTDLSIYLDNYRDIEGYSIGDIETQTLGEASYQKVHLTYTGDYGPGVGGFSVYLFKRGQDIYLLEIIDPEAEHEFELLNTFLIP